MALTGTIGIDSTSKITYRDDGTFEAIWNDVNSESGGAYNSVRHATFDQTANFNANYNAASGAYNEVFSKSGDEEVQLLGIDTYGQPWPKSEHELMLETIFANYVRYSSGNSGEGEGPERGLGDPRSSRYNPAGCRVLASGEKTLLLQVFGSELNLDFVRVGEGSVGPVIHGRSMTPRFIPWFSPSGYAQDFSKLGADKHLFIHEMTHVLQSQKGNYNWLDGPYYFFANLFDYSKTYPYSNDDLGKPLYFFNFEQQADIVADYYTGKIPIQYRDQCRWTLRGFERV